MKDEFVIYRNSEYGCDVDIWRNPETGGWAVNDHGQQKEFDAKQEFKSLTSLINRIRNKINKK